MIEGQPSRTALYVAAARAAHLRFDAPPHLLEDHCAAALLGEEHAPSVEGMTDDAHWVILENRLFMPLRARWVEDRLLAAYRRGVRNYVILGAGLDSFAFRQPAELRELHIIEVDHPATQGWKLSRIEALGWEKPANLTFVDCDFERSTVSEALGRAGFETSATAVVSWMGVVCYLQRSTARAALSELGGLLGSGSEVLFDYLRPYEDLSPRYLELQQISGAYLQRVGEPHVNKLRPEDVEEDIHAAGFQGSILEKRDDIQARYMAGLETSVPLPERFGLAIAVK